MKATVLLTILLTACSVGLVGPLPVGSRAGETSPRTYQSSGKEVYTGTAIGMGGQLGNVSIPFRLEIDGQTSDQEVQQYKQILETKGGAELLRAMSKNKLGTFGFEGRPAHDVNFVQERPEEKGRSITVLFERLVRTFEVSKKTKSADYPFTCIELFINESGKGDGSMVTAAKISLKTNIASIDDFGAFPARLNGVQLRK
jgi:hypothetical protein